MVFTFKNDALTYYYPVRTLISDALNNNELPLWTPFINMGYPLHADMQSSAWNPVTWLFSLTTNYSLAAFHYELIFYITFAGIGFYLLCRELGCSRSVAFLIAIAYQFSGFIIDSVQFFNCISAACYVPYVFIFFRRMILLQRMKDALMLAFFLFLLFTGGYPSFFIILAYALLAYALLFFFKTREKKTFIKKLILPAISAFLVFILLSLPAIISFVQHLPAINRGKSQPLHVVLENSMNPVTMLSLISPFSTTANDSWLNSSVLMRNIYIGIIPLILLLYAFFNKNLKKNKEIVFFIVCAIFMICMAWGEFFFLRQLAYYVLPLMNTFRHPALFRFFTVFFLLLVVALSLNSWKLNKETNRLILEKIIFIILVIALSIGIVSLFYNNLPSLKNVKNIDFKNILSTLNFHSRYLIQLPILIVIILLSYLAIVKKKSIKFICIIVIVDLFLATQLNMPVTVIGATKFIDAEKSMNRIKLPFPIPGNETIEENSMNSFDEHVMTGSRLPFTKKIGRNDYFITPGNLSKQEEFYNSDIRNGVFKYPVLYFADTFNKTSEQKIIYPDGIDSDDPGFKMEGNPLLKDSIKIISLSANQLHANIYKKTNGILVYLQNNYQGWHAFVDGKETPIKIANISFMAIEIPAGQHKILFKYRPKKIILAWYVSMLSLGFLILYYLYLFFSRHRSWKPPQEKI